MNKGITTGFIGIIMVFGCGQAENREIDLHFQQVIDVLGNPTNLEVKSDVLKKVSFYKCAQFYRGKPTNHELERGLRDWTIVDVKENELTPYLWLNNSYWEDFSKDSDNVRRVRNDVLGGDLSRSTFFYRRQDKVLSRLIIYDVDGKSTVVMMESLK